MFLPGTSAAWSEEARTRIGKFLYVCVKLDLGDWDLHTLYKKDWAQYVGKPREDLDYDC